MCLGTVKVGYEAERLARWADTARDWARGQTPAGAPLVEPAQDSAGPREVYVFFISGAKERAPAAAQALIGLLGTRG